MVSFTVFIERRFISELLKHFLKEIFHAILLAKEQPTILT